jgi:hypothetical protein
MPPRAEANIDPNSRPERINIMTKIKEHTCDACLGTGYPVVMQPVQPGRKIYPVKCQACDGKGKITDTTEAALLPYLNVSGLRSAIDI